MIFVSPRSQESFPYTMPFGIVVGGNQTKPGAGLDLTPILVKSSFYAVSCWRSNHLRY